MNSPRIAFVSGNLNLGGSTTFLCNAAGEMVRRGVPVRVFCTESSHPMAADFARQCIPVFIADERRLIYEDRIAAVVKELRAFEPTLVVGCLAPPSFEILRYVPQGIGRVAMVQSDDPGVYNTLEAFREYLDGVVGVSKTIEARLHALPPFSGKQIAYIPYGVPMPSLLPPSEASTGPLRILYLGRLSDVQKRVRLFPQIYKELCASGIPFQWTLAGEGPERAYLEANMTGGRPDQRVLFLGQVDYEGVPALLEGQDVLLLASTFEGLPLSLLEAMGQGVVPVVTDLESGISEVVNETNGMLVPMDDIQGYAKALIRLHNDRSDLAGKSRQARASVYPAYSVAAMTDRWLELAGHLKGVPAPWPENPSSRIPLGCENALLFSMPGRFLRRCRVWLRACGFPC